MSKTIQKVLQEATEQGIDRGDARYLLAHVMQVDRSYFIAHPDKILSSMQFIQWEQLLSRRLSGEPIAYCLGEKEFFSLLLKVTQDTLIPRPETELLVEEILNRFDHSPRSLVDLGTGTGAIAIALAHSRPQWNIIACDIHAKTLAVAKENAKRHRVKIDFRKGSWCDPLQGESVDIMVSNPPYIAEGDPHLHEGDVRFEPPRALVSKKNGLADIETIMQQAKTYLVPGGLLLLEHGYDQGETLKTMFDMFGYQCIFQRKTGQWIRLSGGFLNK